MADDITPAVTPPTSATLVGGTPPVVSNPGAGAPVPATPATPQPVSYDTLTLPEGASLNPAHLEQVKVLAKDLGLSPEAAQKLIERDNMVQKDWMKGHQDTWSAEVSGWKKQIETDKDFGGEKLPATIANARQALGKFGSPEFTSMLEKTGYGNHPELIKMLSKIGASMKEDQMAGRSAGSPSATTDKALQLYPSMKGLS